MKIDFSELKGISTYNFKKDKGVGVKILYNKEDVFKLKDMYFIVYNESGMYFIRVVKVVLL